MNKVVLAAYLVMLDAETIEFDIVSFRIGNLQYSKQLPILQQVWKAYYEKNKSTKIIQQH